MTNLIQTIQADIYKLDPDKYIGSTINTIQRIVKTHSTSASHQTYIHVPLKSGLNETKEFKIRLYVNEVLDSQPEWVIFLNEIAHENEQEYINKLKRKFPSFIIFIYNNEHIYAVTKGGGHFVINKYIKEDFGVEILERLIDENDSDLRSISERVVIGNVLAAQKFFKPDHKFTDEQSFAKFYKAIDALISKDKLYNLLGIKTTRTSMIIRGENNLKIGNQLKFDELINRVVKVNSLINATKTAHLNKFKKVTKKQLEVALLNETLEMRLNNILIAQCFQEFVNSDFQEIYHPNIFKYLQANSVNFKRDEELINIDCNNRIDLDLIFSSFNLTINSINEFKDEMNEIKTFLVFENEDDFPHQANLIQWLIGDVILDGIKYFKFDGEWFRYENEFITEINNRVNRLLRKIGTPEILPAWINQTEGEYNRSFIGNGVLVCDRAMYKNIEICDFIKFDLTGQGLKLYHVKDGWGQSIRIVYNQIINGARFISEFRNNSGRLNTNKLREYYNSIKHTHYSNGHTIPVDFDQFKNLVNRKNVTFVLVYGHTNRTDRDSQITRSNSNIAKLSIIQCENELRSSYDFGFDIVKVNRS